jgi:NAD(P)-dependent dehydrogenase (short-subunit alcohol dehydrogenase family)
MRVLVVGAARPPGIGRATVARLARAGASLVLADATGGGGTGAADPALLEGVRAEASSLSGRSVTAYPVDPTDPASVAALVDSAVRDLGRLDGCCNLVGATGPGFGDGPLVDVEPEAWQRGLAWNLTAAWLIARACVPVMDPGGAIVTLSSYAGLDPTPEAGVVGVARAAVNHMVAMLARELGPKGIRLCTVCPLGVKGANPGLAALAARHGSTVDEYLAGRIPLGRGQSPDEVASAIAFLLSADASFISGVSLPVAGGART